MWVSINEDHLKRKKDFFEKDVPRIIEEPKTEKLEKQEKTYEYYIGKTAAEIGTDPDYKFRLYYPSIIFWSLLHVGAVIGLYLCFSGAKWSTVLWAFFIGYVGSEAITVGTHRYYTHRSFKATFAMRCIIIILNTIAGQNSIYIWARDHRIHHKYSDTDADPHNASRGFFFCHMGWLMVKKHPAFKAKAISLDTSDLKNDKLVMFQFKYYYPLYIIFSVMFPVYVPIYFFGETFFNALCVAYFFRWAGFLHGTWTVNSLAHLYGNKPYEKDILPRENNFVAFISLGEGWHNYHHTFPWDYKASEYGLRYNFTASLIEYLASWGLVYDLKQVSDEIVKKRMARTGDGTDMLYYKYK